MKVLFHISSNKRSGVPAVSRIRERTHERNPYVTFFIQVTCICGM
jgi:hypothetical protein